MAGISGVEQVCLALSRELCSRLSWAAHPVAGYNEMGRLAGRSCSTAVCAACLRQWAQYLIFSNRVVMRNGYTGRDIQTVTHEVIAEINLSQVPIARFLNIGTLVVHCKSG